jgi:hypothetical protein
VERNGEPMCRILPLAGVRGATVSDLAVLLQTTPWPDDSFANDLEHIHQKQQKQSKQQKQPKLPRFPWDS